MRRISGAGECHGDLLWHGCPDDPFDRRPAGSDHFKYDAAQQTQSALQIITGDTHLSILTLDEEGVELNKEASQLVRMAWNNVAFLRVFDESLCFFGKDARGIVIAVNRNHEKQILDYISDNGIDVKIIGH